MAPRQNLPIVLDFGDGRALRAVTRTLDRSGLSFYIDARCPFRARGTRSPSRRASAAAALAAGRSVLRVDHVDDGVGREMVAICDVLELHGAAERVIARAGFRERVVEFATKHRDGEKHPGGRRRRSDASDASGHEPDPSARGALDPGAAAAEARAAAAGAGAGPAPVARRPPAPGHVEAEAPGPNASGASVAPSLGSRQPLQARLVGAESQRFIVCAVRP